MLPFMIAYGGRVVGQINASNVAMGVLRSCTIGDWVVPRLGRAAQEAGRPRPRVVVGVPVAVTDDPDGLRAAAATDYAAYARLPSYAATLERDGFTSPGDIVVAGDETAVAAGLRGYVDAGATDLNISLLGDDTTRARTLDALTAVAPGPASGQGQSRPAAQGSVGVGRW